MKLSAGERYPLTDEKMYIVLTSGKAEVYAVTKQQDSFRQMFLTELALGEAAFPSMDEFGMVDVVVYAVEDAELDLLPLAEGAPASLAPLMRQWFSRLVELPWLRLLADRGDDMLKTWADGSTLDGNTTDMAALSKTAAVMDSLFLVLRSFFSFSIYSGRSFERLTSSPASIWLKTLSTRYWISSSSLQPLQLSRWLRKMRRESLSSVSSIKAGIILENSLQVIDKTSGQ